MSVAATCAAFNNVFCHDDVSCSQVSSPCFTDSDDSSDLDASDSATASTVVRGVEEDLTGPLNPNDVTALADVAATSAVAAELDATDGGSCSRFAKRCVSVDESYQSVGHEDHDDDDDDVVPSTPQKARRAEPQLVLSESPSCSSGMEDCEVDSDGEPMVLEDLVEDAAARHTDRGAVMEIGGQGCWAKRILDTNARRRRRRKHARRSSRDAMIARAAAALRDLRNSIVAFAGRGSDHSPERGWRSPPATTRPDMIGDFSSTHAIVVTDENQPPQPLSLSPLQRPMDEPSSMLLSYDTVDLGEAPFRSASPSLIAARCGAYETEVSAALSSPSSRPLRESCDADNEDGEWITWKPAYASGSANV